MEKRITRTIHFSDRKIVMKPIEGKGLIEIWTTTPPINEKITQFIKRKGVLYFLNSSIDKSQQNQPLMVE
jgi:ribosomal protein L36